MIGTIALILILAFADAAGVARPKHIEIPTVYPPLARQAQITGTVVLVIRVSPEGNVIAVDVKDGHPILREPAKNAVKHWTFDCANCASPIDTEFSVRYRLRDITASDADLGVSLDLPNVMTITANKAVVYP